MPPPPRRRRRSRPGVLPPAAPNLDPPETRQILIRLTPEEDRRLDELSGHLSLNRQSVIRTILKRQHDQVFKEYARAEQDLCFRRWQEIILVAQRAGRQGNEAFARASYDHLERHVESSNLSVEAREAILALLATTLAISPAQAAAPRVAGRADQQGGRASKLQAAPRRAPRSAP